MNLLEKKLLESVEAQSFFLLEKHKRYLNILKPILNEIHQVSYSEKYWNILLGAWLIKMLASVYEKYDKQTGIKSERGTFLNKPQLISKKIPPFWKIVTHERYEFLTEWNEYLIALVKYFLASLNNNKLQIDEEFYLEQDKSAKWEQKIERIKLQAWGAFFRIKNNSKEIGITTNYQYFLNKDIRNAFSKDLRDTGNILFIEDLNDFFKCNFTPNQKLRSTLRDKISEFFDDLDEFDKIFFLILVEVFPIHYLEAFSQRSYLSLMAKKIQLKKCVVFNDLFDSLNQNFFVAGQVELNNCKLIEIEHGGCTFTRGRLLRLWGHGVLDNFVSGGKHFPVSQTKDLAFYSLKGLNITTKHKYIKSLSLRVLYVTSQYSSQINFLLQVSVEVLFPQQYLSAIATFINCFLEKKNHFLEWRPYLSRVDRKDNHVEYTLQAINKNLIPRLLVHINDSFYKRLERADIYVTDHFSTTILEAFLYEIPVVAFWEDAFDGHFMDDRACAVMKKLRMVQILHSDAQSAANFLDEKEKLEHWWRQADVIAVREEFKEMFFRASPNGMDTFVNFIKEV